MSQSLAHLRLFECLIYLTPIVMMPRDDASAAYLTALPLDTYRDDASAAYITTLPLDTYRDDKRLILP